MKKHLSSAAVLLSLLLVLCMYAFTSDRDYTDSGSSSLAPYHKGYLFSPIQGASYAESLKEENGFDITYFEDSPTMYQAVLGGQVVACFEDTPIMASSIKDGGLNLRIVEGSENEGAPYGFAVFSADKQELVDKFNAGLANIKESGVYDEIIAKYLGTEEAPAETEAE